MSCSIPDCTSTQKGYRGWCNAHYLRWLRHGDPLGFTPRKKRGLCSIEHCGRPHRSKGLCQFHYNDELYEIRRRRGAAGSFDKTPKGRFACGRRSASKRGISWELTLSEYTDLTGDKFCYYGCGNKLPPKGCGLDRIDSSLGYNTSNVVPCCSTCNKSRLNNFSSDEWKVMIAALVGFRKTK